MINKDLSSSALILAVTKHDTNQLNGSTPTRGLYVGGAGDVVVTPAGGGADVTFAAVPAGTILPIQVLLVKTASTASNIVALF